MTLDIRAGMFAVLRDGTVPEEAIQRIRGGRWCWMVAGETYQIDGSWGVNPNELLDIVSVHATRAEALAYVADNPMNRELYPDGPDLAPAPVVVDWKARAEAAEAALQAVRPWLDRVEGYYAFGSKDYEAAVELADAALVAAAKEPRHE